MRRLVSAGIAVVGALLLVSLFLNLVPGDPIDVMLGRAGAPVDRAGAAARGGDGPAVVAQLWTFTRDFATGELRTSLPPFQRKVLPAIAAALPSTLRADGGLAAHRGGSSRFRWGWRRRRARARRWTQAAMGVAVAGVALPRFWLGPMLIIVFALWLDWLPGVRRRVAGATWCCPR